MPINRQDIEQEIQVKNLTRPRVTHERVLAQHKGSIPMYYVFPGTTVTVCCLPLRNGFCVTGISAAASPENYDRELGEKVALSKAIDKIWELEGYSLCSALTSESGI